MAPQIMNLLRSHALIPRFVPIPPSTYIHAAKLSAKLIVAIVLLVLVSILTITLLCCCCIKRRRRRARARRLAKEAAESKQLKPRINRRNARFFAPGLVLERERQSQRGVDVEMGTWVGESERRSSSGRGREVKMPERAWVRCKEVLRGEVRGGRR